MKYLYKISAILLLSAPFCLTSFAAEETKAAETTPAAPATTEPAQKMGMAGKGGGMDDQHLRAMQEYSLKQHDLSNQILAEKDPAKKEQLKNQQLELMKEHQMQMMGHRQQKMQHKMPQ